MEPVNIPLGLRFSLLHRCCKKKMDEMLQEKGLTGVQFRLLALLIHREQSDPGEIYQKDLEQMLQVSHPTMTDMLRRLEKKGFLRCESGSRDRRCKRILSTEKARALEQDVARVEKATRDWLCQGLSPEQIRQLIGITDVMLQNLAPCCGKGSDDET
ncbi:MAG: MarR family transcriptional regulator [Oscillospiraceae bacterium]|nr:MarR family transcriptional regulator [Oscillospiraceae bacterium]